MWRTDAVVKAAMQDLAKAAKVMCIGRIDAVDPGGRDDPLARDQMRRVKNKRSRNARLLPVCLLACGGPLAK